jgi:hypothetical protein
MGSVHQFPAKRNQAASLPPVAAVTQALREAVDATVGSDATFAQREELALALANDATRQFLQDDLEMIAESHGAQVDVDGRLYQRHEPGTVRYYTLCGGMDLERWTYREVGVRNGPTIVPLDLEAGIVEQATPALGYRVALGYAKDHMRSCEEDMRADHRCPPSRSTLERMAKAIGTEATRVATRLTARVRCAERLPEGTVAIALGLDRATVPMEEELAEGDVPTTRRKARRKPYVREQPPRVNVQYRMAYVGTISFHDADGELLGSRCYTAPAHEDPQDRLVVPLMADLRHALRQDATVAVGIIQDGAPELWSLLRAGVAAEPQVTTCYEAIDRYHLNEHLAGVLRVLEPDAETRKTRLSQWNESLDCNDKAIYRIRTEIRTAYVEAMVVQDQAVQKALDPHVTYLDNNASLMRYARLRAVGLPVGSGVTEAACKSVIELRTNGRSQRWRPAGLDAVLRLRSIHISDRLPRFWANLARTYRKEVALCA